MKPSTRLGARLAATSAIIGWLALCSAAGGKIVLGKSIHGVKVGMTRAQVQSRLGPGTKQHYKGGVLLAYRNDLYEVIFVGGKARSVETSNPKERTSGGLGVGTKLGQLKKSRPAVYCVGGRGQLYCFLGGGKKGAMRTEFYFDGSNRVSAVLISRS